MIAVHILLGSNSQPKHCVSLVEYPYEVAEQKGVEVTVLARSRGFPLQVKIEKE